MADTAHWWPSDPGGSQAANIKAVLVATRKGELK